MPALTAESTARQSSPGTSRGPDWANRGLRAAAAFWFLVAVIGQLFFATYVALFYGRATLGGDLTAWNKVMPHGFIAGDAIGNLAVGLHLFWAVVITLAGAIQLIPQIRARRPVLHRWTGRLYLISAAIASLSGLFMVWTRGTVGGMTQHISISLNALLILVCAALALYYARARQFGAHRRWALRLFLAASGVWFFRVGLMLWLLIHRAPVGFDPKTFQGPFLTFLAFGQYLIPLAVLQLYFRAQESRAPWGQSLMAASLVVMTVAMGAGIFAAAMGMWLPRL